ncbi:hypothetical protein PHLGIDRAFT_17278, partial [Phlebiopsis gigantea 11061_1 CR5-6]
MPAKPKKIAEPAPSGKKAQKRKEREQAEQEEAERVSKLPRRSKEKAKVNKDGCMDHNLQVWMSTQTGTRKRSKKADASSGDHSDGESVVQSQRKRKSKDIGEHQRRDDNDEDKTDQEQYLAKRKKAKTQLKNADAKQKPALGRPVFNHQLVNNDTDANGIESPPLPVKTIIVKPSSRRSGTISKTLKQKSVATKSSKVSKNGGGSDESDESDEESSSSSEDDDSESSSDEDSSDKPSDSELSDQDDGDYEDSDVEEDDDSNNEDPDDEDDELRGGKQLNLNAPNAGSLDSGPSPQATIPEGPQDDHDLEDEDVGVSNIPGSHAGAERSESCRASTTSSRLSGAPHNPSLPSDEEEDDPGECKLKVSKTLKTASKRPAKTASKNKKRLEDVGTSTTYRVRPRMQVVANTVSNTVNVSSKGARAVAARVGRTTRENLARWELEQPSITRLVYSDRKEININSQSDPIKKLGQALIKEFHRIQAFEHGFFPADEKFRMQQDIVLRVAREIKTEKRIMKRLQYDNWYLKMFAKMADLRNLQFVGKTLRPAAAPYIQAQYKIPVVLTPEQLTNLEPAAPGEPDPKLTVTKDRVSQLLSALAFAHSGVSLSGPTQMGVDSNKILDLPILGQVIQKAWFTVDGHGHPSLASQYADLFTSSDYYKPHEKEIPDVMVGMACAGISEALRCWSTGEHKVVSVSTSAAEGQYDTCMHLLAELRETSPVCYHRVKHNLYLAAT